MCSYGHWSDDICYGCAATMAIFDSGNMVIAHTVRVDASKRNIARHEEKPKFSAAQYSQSESIIDSLRQGDDVNFILCWFDARTRAAKSLIHELENSDITLPFLGNNVTKQNLKPYTKLRDWLKKRGI